MNYEKTALDMMFQDLQIEKRELKDNYRKDLAAIEKRQFDILDRLQRLDDWQRGQVEKYQEEAAAAKLEAETLGNLERMTLPPSFEMKRAEDHPHYKKKVVSMEEAAATALAETAATTLAEVPGPDSLDAVAAAVGVAGPAFATGGFKMADLIKVPEELKTAPEDTEEPKKPDYVYTGIKERNGVEHYQLYYTCSNERCRHKGKHFVPKQTIETYCHSCGRKMRVRPATKAGFPNKDSFNNYFVAGKRKTEEEMAEAYANPVESIDKTLEIYEQERAAAKVEVTTPAPRPEPKSNKPGKMEPRTKKTKPAKNKKNAAAKKPAAPRKKPADLVAAAEMLIEDAGKMKWKHLEQQIKENFGWEWANFYNAFNRSLAMHPNRIIKDGSHFIVIPKNKEEGIQHENGQNNIEQEAQTV